MSDKWYYTHGDEVHGPVSADELRRLAQTGGLLAADLIWSAGVDASTAVPAEAALSLASRAGADRAESEPAATPLPEWVRDLADVLAQGRDPAALPHAPFASWLADVRRAEENARPAKGPPAREYFGRPAGGCTFSGARVPGFKHRFKTGASENRLAPSCTSSTILGMQMFHQVFLS